MTDLLKIMDQSHTLPRVYPAWRPPPRTTQLADNLAKFQGSQALSFLPGNSNRSNWKPKNLNETRRNDLNDSDSHSQNRSKSRRFYHKKKFNYRFAPFAPRNTTSFLIRAKKSGGIASLVSPCPVTPATLPTPIFSPSREVLVDMAKEEWGVDGYGSMNGLIRLRSPGNEADEEEEETGGGGSSGSDVEERVEVERRLDHDLSRFEMIYPNKPGCRENEERNMSILKRRFDDQYSHIAQLEDENLTLRERLFIMERDLEDLRRRVQCLETSRGRHRHDNQDEASENVSDNEVGDGNNCSEKSVGDVDGQ